MTDRPATVPPTVPRFSPAKQASGTIGTIGTVQLLNFLTGGAITRFSTHITR
jgi:hypothetical protein